MKISNALVKLFAKGNECDPVLLELLYKWYGMAVYRVAYYYLNEKMAAEDVTQDTFLSAFTKLHQLKDPAKIKAWLIRTAINKAYDLLRKNRAMVLDEEAMFKNASSEPFVERLIDEEKKQELTTALLMLPLQYQDVLYYKYYVEYTTKQIAELLDMPEGTVKSRLFKARGLLLKYLSMRERGCEGR